MPLINPRLQKNTLQIKAIPQTHLEILSAWQQSIHKRTLFSQKETALHSHFIQKILIEVLGYTGFNGESWNLSQEQKISTGSVDVALGTFTAEHSQIIAPFELKGAKTKDLDAIMPGRHKSPVQQAWEYAMDAPGASWVLVSNYLEIRLYAIGYGRQNYESWDLSKLTEPGEYARLQWLLSSKQLLTGETAAILQQSEALDKEITDKLYCNYKALRETLFNTLITDNPGTPALDIIRHTQKILDRILFIAFAEDRGLLPDKTLAHAYQHTDPYNPRPIWENFNGLFRAIDQGNASLKIPAYNGGLFASDEPLETLSVSDTLCQAFKDLGEYDFASEISVTVLGHIFEQSISDIENLQMQAQAEQNDTPVQLEKHGKRKKHGVVYTPDHITRFIVEHTLGKHLQTAFETLWQNGAAQRHKTGSWKKKAFEIEFWRNYQYILRTTRVLDPACGSGAFLVAAFDFLYAEYQRINDILADLTGAYDVFDLDKEILNQNLYGVDLNSESVEITKLSLWLKTAQRGKVLNSLDANIKVGNSLIDDAKYSEQAFNWAENFPHIFTEAAQEGWFDDVIDTVAGWFSDRQSGGFDVILGNPPYVRQELISPIKPCLEKNYQVYTGVVDLYAYFFELGLKLLKPGGRMGYISSSTFFKTGSGKNLRQYLMDNATLETVVDFGDLQVFAGVTTYPAILTMRKQAAEAQHRLQMLVLKQLPEDLDKCFAESALPMSQHNLESSAWRLESDTLLALRQKITQDKPTLKEMYGSPLYGIKTGLNAAFVIDTPTRNALIQADAKSAELIKPFFEGKDLKKWRVEPRKLWIIFIPWHFPLHKDNTIKGASEKAEKEFMENYPSVYAHLLNYKEKLVRRNKSETGIRYEWYALQRWAASYYEEFEKEKIIYGHFSPNSLFSLEKTRAYSNDKSYIIPKAGFYELGLLNSHLYWFLIKSLCPFVRGGYYEVRSQYIQTLPIPPATEAQKQSIAQIAENCQKIAENRYQKQQAVRRRIPDLCPAEREAKLNTKLKNWWQLDFPAFRKEIKKAFKQDIPLQDRNDWEHWLTQERATIEALSAQLQQQETVLNNEVYVLFDLTAEEIKLIENP
ncbi:Eco57I restriction-modification methylase domain-containing protein [Candidatus Venteria ishoeyi]|uniref:site-specific DNA-methyltransferase (adenine-specific) n=1 Tax=Candidatus Venteria ishoeyi TaxID=1899563 RepID=A0A1H6F4N8_9GAMM|nr:N-6 DNA methylase [Candidatus Venteria ishoeyi]SEH04229.1 Type IIS restriction enzyme Eco57I [Candidatus Venteria ishoeyi]